jgi:hypothetical protein
VEGNHYGSYYPVCAYIHLLPPFKFFQLTYDYSVLVLYHIHLYHGPQQGGELGEEVWSKPSTSSFAPQNTELGGEDPAAVFAVPRPSCNQSHWRAPHRKAAQFPLLPLLRRLPP